MQANTLPDPVGTKTNAALLTEEQLAAELQTSKRSIAYWRAQGLIPSVRVGRHLVRFDLGDVLSHLKRCSPKHGSIR